MKKLEPIFFFIGEILAVLLVVVWAVLIINSNFEFITNATVMNILTVIKEYGGLLLIGVVGLEAMCKRNFIFFLIFCLLVALIVIFLFFPGTYQQLINMV